MDVLQILLTKDVTAMTRDCADLEIEMPGWRFEEFPAVTSPFIILFPIRRLERTSG